MEELFEGIVIFFIPKRGYGFLEWYKNGIRQSDLFVHYSDILINGFKTLNKNQKVSFKLGKNANGIIKAIDVTLI